MEQDNTKEHKTICIDPGKFKAQLTPDNFGERIFDEGDVLKFLIDQMNEAGVDIAMIHHGHEHAIEYHHYEHAVEYGGRRDYFSMGIASPNAPEDAVIDGMAELSDTLNDHDEIESWTSYKDGKHCLHIAEAATSESEEKPEAAPTTSTEDQRTEDLTEDQRKELDRI